MRADWQRPHPSRLDPGLPGSDQIMAAHDAAVEAGEAGYPDPRTGWWVFTAPALADAGRCCVQGCRHCPWVDA
ncbi:MAG: DUF5522 domain-containing protein [Actinomycetota bacterium]|nr:DUF5522 domain-containing protein [Actinomycetota bacterium]